MATIQEAKRRLTIEATSRGVKEAAQDAKALATEMAGVSVAAEKQGKATVSAERALDRIQRRYDAAMRAQMEMARVERDLARAQAQGLIGLDRRIELLSMVAEKHGMASAAISREAQAYRELAAAERLAATSADGQAMWNAYAGVRSIAPGGARESAAVFAAELDRIEEIARLKAQQIGAAFTEDFNRSIMRHSGKSARESAAVFEAQQREMDEIARRASLLRAQIDPLGAAQDRLNAEMAEYAMLADRGAINAQELSAAQAMAKTRFEQTTAAIRAQTGAMAAQSKSFHTTNLLFQMQDIGMMAAMGQAPHILALQQGTQVAGIFHQIGNGRAIVEALKGAFVGLLNPISLATVGVIGLGTAFYQWMTSGEQSVDKLDAALKNHKALIDEIRAAYGDAAIAATDYAKYTADEFNLRMRASAAEMQMQLKVGLDDLLKGGEIGYATRSVAAPYLPVAEFEAFRDQIARLWREGQPALASIRQEIVEIGQTQGLERQALKLLEFLNPLFKLDEGIQQSKQGIDNFAISMRDLSNLVDTIHSEKAQRELNKIAEEAINGEKAAKDLKMALAAISGYAPDVSTAISEFMRLIGVIRDAKAEAEGMVWPNGKPIGSPSQGGRVRYNTTGFMQLPETVGVTPTDRVDPYFLPKERGGGRSDPWRDLVKNARDQIETLRAVRDTFGMVGVEADTYRFKLDLLQKATDKGREIDRKKIEEIDKLAASYRKAAEDAAFLAAQEALRVERDTMFLSPTEQRVYGELRQYGLSESSPYGKIIADQIRLNEQMKLGRDLTREFAGGLVSDLLNGVSATEALSNAFGRLADRLLQMAMDEMINSLFRNLLGSALGGVSPTSPFWRPNTTAGAFFTSGFASGGYTGPGAASNPAGIVHAGEYVFSKQATDRLGVGYLDSLHNAAKGYMAGGLVSRMYAPANANLRGYQTGGFVPVPQFQGNAAAAQAPREVNFNMHVSVSGNGDKELEARLQKATEIQMNEALRSYDREVLPARVNQIANDPHAVG